MSEKVRARVANSCLVSILKYGVEFYIAQNVRIVNKWWVEMMKLAKHVKRSACLRIRNSLVCSSLDWLTPNQILLRSVIKFIHTIMHTHRPQQIYDWFRPPRTRPGAKVGLKYPTRSSVVENTLVFKSHLLYNSLTDSQRLLSPKELKKNIDDIELKFPT